MVLLDTPVFTFAAVISACGITACAASVTVPTMLPVVAWPLQGSADESQIRLNAASNIPLMVGNTLARWLRESGDAMHNCVSEIWRTASKDVALC